MGQRFDELASAMVGQVANRLGWQRLIWGVDGFECSSRTGFFTHPTTRCFMGQSPAIRCMVLVVGFALDGMVLQQLDAQRPAVPRGGSVGVDVVIGFAYLSPLPAFLYRHVCGRVGGLFAVGFCVLVVSMV